MSGLPYCITLPIKDRDHWRDTGIITTNINSIKPNRDDPNQSIIHMLDGRSFHFCSLSVKGVMNRINDFLDEIDNEI